MNTKNIFVLGLTDVQRRELETVRNAEDLAFHGVLDYETLVNTTDLDFDQLLHDARAELDAFDGSIDAIIAHWDFPVSVLATVLAAENGLPAPSLESLLKSEHKYWSRLEQQRCIPECVPGVAAFDPFDDDALATIGLDFPFWVKPVKAHSSALGFKVEDEAQFAAALEEIREHIGEIGDAFNQVLRRVALPAELEGAGGNSCLAEQFVEGTQVAPEGTMFRGEYHVHGVFDMHKDEAGTSFSRLDYPASSVPEPVQQRMIDLTERYLRQVGYDDGCFNSEFMWDREQDQLWLIEVNTRISQSHSDLFAKVDGSSNHEVAIDIALGEKPRMPHREGEFATAAQCMLFHDEDAVVTRVPSAEDKAELARRWPGTLLTLQVAEGDRLSELPGQDSYRFILGKLYIGADSTEQLVERYREIAAEIPFEFAPAPADG
ncbi:ATP-grasp domain-containing protein [Brachybacterium paraconglomeratum]|uniref:ATP-grasp domain-containing protein n=1 Tax=Brachybacterium paraconglomeratum TaxID=173362 RepID=UPI00026C6986|nr:ATP-grasp domain-containing protein [Brachybacterium paraconglomeratum]